MSRPAFLDAAPKHRWERPWRVQGGELEEIRPGLWLGRLGYGNKPKVYRLSLMNDEGVVLTVDNTQGYRKNREPYNAWLGRGGSEIGGRVYFANAQIAEKFLREFHHILIP